MDYQDKTAAESVDSMNKPMMARPDYGRADMEYRTAPRTWTGRRYISSRSNMEMEFINETDQHGNPAGGRVNGCGFRIWWQDGPMNREEDEHAGGAFVEDVLNAVIDRLTFYQEGKFACEENAHALHALMVAQEHMDDRIRDRTERSVLGKHLG